MRSIAGPLGLLAASRGAWGAWDAGGGWSWAGDPDTGFAMPSNVKVEPIGKPMPEAVDELRASSSAFREGRAYKYAEYGAGAIEADDGLPRCRGLGGEGLRRLQGRRGRYRTCEGWPSIGPMALMAGIHIQDAPGDRGGDATRTEAEKDPVNGMPASGPPVAEHRVRHRQRGGL